MPREMTIFPGPVTYLPFPCVSGSSDDWKKLIHIVVQIRVVLPYSGITLFLAMNPLL